MRVGPPPPPPPAYTLRLWPDYTVVMPSMHNLLSDIVTDISVTVEKAKKFIRSAYLARYTIEIWT